MGSEKDYQKWLNDTTKHCDTDAMVAMIRQQAAEIERLKACIRDACYLDEGLKILLDQVDELLMTHKPLERKKAGE